LLFMYSNFFLSPTIEFPSLNINYVWSWQNPHHSPSTNPPHKTCSKTTSHLPTDTKSSDCPNRVPPQFSTQSPTKHTLFPIW
jgi:hypothetical protein